MNYKPIFLVLCSGFFLSACSEDFFDQEVAKVPASLKESDIVIQAFCAKDSLIKVQLGRTKPFSDQSITDFFLPDAVVSIESNGLSYPMVYKEQKSDTYGSRIQQSVYQTVDTSLHFVAGQSYTVKASFKGKMATASCMIPVGAPAFTYTIDSVTYREGGDPQYAPEVTSYYATLRWTPQAHDDGYYLVQSASQPKYQSSGIWNKGYYTGDRLLTAADQVNGRYEVTVELERNYSYPGSTEQRQEERFKLLLLKINQDFYLFSKTYLPNTYHGDPFAEPVNLYSNVKGGYGIFTGFAYTDQEFEAIW